MIPWGQRTGLVPCPPKDTQCRLNSARDQCSPDLQQARINRTQSSHPIPDSCLQSPEDVFHMGEDHPFTNCLQLKAGLARGCRRPSLRWLPNFWIVLLSCILFVLNETRADADFHFPDMKQRTFAQDLTHFHITWPARVSPIGQFHHTHHSTRTKRSPSLQSSSSQDVHHFQMTLQQDTPVTVQASRSDYLLAPSAVLERKFSKFRNLSDTVFSTLEHHRGCHVVGAVNGAPDSRVALSVCGGLRGFLQVNGSDYLIEPVRGVQPSEGQGHPHLVYRRSALPEHLKPSPAKVTVSPGEKVQEPPCGVSGSIERDFHQRERWESHRRGRTRRESAQQASHSRQKRSISIEKHVETLVVIDTDMVNYYENEDIETYVLTVMNMVATLFHDASIGNAVNIVIVRMILMQDPDEDLQIAHHADKTLKSFCKWQKNINFRDDDHPNHHDVAVLMTRRNICSRNNEPCSTLGLAQVAGLCQPHRTCSINEDTGLSLAWTVAHELGHNFGMKHDNQHSDCMSEPDVQFVMAPHLAWDKTPSSWSNCSRTSITKFLDRNWGYCLDDPPGQHDFKYPELPAGTMYDADHQCRLLYGEGAERCHGIETLENICTTLWCRVNNKCTTKLQPAAVGTICGHDKWCFAGQCVDIGERPQAIDGQWGQWQEWTECTRTCGAGVSVSQRHCHNPPPSNGGKYCTGERKRYRICNTDNCQEEGPHSFRATQCAEFNEIPYKGTLYEWEPVITPETPCQLHCKPKDMFFSVMLKDTVTDGTPCAIGSRHMCISGRCRHVGCDWVIDSAAVEDRCGVCFGDGSTCQTIREQFNETNIKGYVEATVIPAGARNIRVEEVAEANNFLALRNQAGQYYLNGHWFIQWSGDYECAGTVFHYKREGNKEQFVAPGPLSEPLHIMLLMQTYNPGVEFEYTVPKENATNNRKPEFSWDYQGWSHCTVSCGGGTQRSAVVCKEKEAGLVDESFCDQTTKPDDQMRACNVHLCPARWWTGPWQHCSVTCGVGIHQRTVICVRSLGSDEQIALEDLPCEGLDKPVELGVCHRDHCPVLGVWEIGDWSQCSATCNGGVQSRNTTCVGGTLCSPNERPYSSQPCHEQPCPDSSDNSMLDVAGDQGNSMINIKEGDQSTNIHNIEEGDRSKNIHNIEEGGQSKNIHNIEEGDQSKNIHNIEEGGQSKNIHNIEEGDQSKNIHNIEEGDQSKNIHNIEEGDQSKNIHNIEEGGQSKNIHNIEEGGQSKNIHNIEEGNQDNNIPNLEESGQNNTKLNIEEGGEINIMLNIQEGGENNSKLNVVGGDENSSNLNIEEGGENNSKLNVVEGGENNSKLNVEGGDENSSNLNIVEGGENNSKLNIEEAGENNSKLNIEEAGDDNSMLNQEKGGENNKVSDTKEGSESLDQDKVSSDSLLLPSTNFSTSSSPPGDGTDNNSSSSPSDGSYNSSGIMDLLPLGNDSQNIFTMGDEDHKIVVNDSKSASEMTNNMTEENNVNIENINSGDTNQSVSLSGTNGLSNEGTSQPNNIRTIAGHTFTLSKGEDDVLNNVRNMKDHSGSLSESVILSNSLTDLPAVSLDINSEYLWKAEPWSQCTSQCGQGVRTRETLCVQAKTGQKVEIGNCDISHKPATIEDCFDSLCQEWHAGNWGQCSTSCGQGTQSREVSCPEAGRCDVTRKLASSKTCENFTSCILWVVGDWSLCSKSCSQGSQERLVQCVNLTSQQLSPSCPPHQKPADRQNCNPHECPPDDNAALTISCESNEMSFHVCQMLKKVGLCHKPYVQTKCCRTCHQDNRPKPDTPHQT